MPPPEEKRGEENREEKVVSSAVSECLDTHSRESVDSM